MAPSKFDRIVSVSSEDPAFPAENLLKNAYSDKKWKNKEPGEKQISVVIQMEKAEKICAVDVGNYGSAFIEILVSKSSNPDDFKVLVVASSLMSLQEAKLGNNISSVRFFKENNLVKEVAAEKWDRIKVICSQPYNKHIQYGLAFIVIHSVNASITDTPASTLGKFQLKKNDNSEGLTIGSLFAKRKENGSVELKGAAAIRAASTSGIINMKMSPQIGTSSVAESQLTISDNENSMQNEAKDLDALLADSGSEYEPDSHASSESDLNDSIDTSPRKLRKKTPKAPKVSKDNTPKNKPKDNGNDGSSSSGSRNNKANKRTAEDIKENARKRVPVKTRLEKPFNQLFEGVIFTISGFQNPYRSEVRNKALAMGAKYRPDWDNTCTHLLCAFPNTPKFNQVLGQGKIITKEWIEACYNRRMRLPWRRYALHPPDKAAPESEDEIFEKVARPPSPVDNRRRVSPGRSSGEDTEEEIERVLQIQARNQIANSSEDNDVRVVNGNRTSTSNESLPKVPVSKREKEQKLFIAESHVRKKEKLEYESETSLEAEEEVGVVEEDTSRTETPKKKKKTKEKESPILKIKPKDSKKERHLKNEKLEIEKQSCEESEQDEEIASENASVLENNKSPKKKKKPKEKELSKLKTARNDISKSDKAADIPEVTYDMDTEEEDESSDSKKWNLPFLPTFFEGIKFYVAQDLNETLQKQLKRYIFAHKGSLIEEDDLLYEEIQFVITESKEEVRKVKVNCPNVIGLRPEWVWKAHDECRVAPTSTFEITS